ncbi:uncharacterized protein LOC143297939 [Babylonia areolata]|uniref:uncharacterized protein LOC143297939 n=1 Tax=Babylonia areolata TaxID=304850 RepID=UPI003FD2A791
MAVPSHSLPVMPTVLLVFLCSLPVHCFSPQATMRPDLPEDDNNDGTSHLHQNEFFVNYGVLVEGTLPVEDSSDDDDVDLNNDVPSSPDSEEEPEDEDEEEEEDGETGTDHTPFLHHPTGQNNTTPKRRRKRGISMMDTDKLWTNGIVPYEFDMSRLSEGYVRNIKGTIAIMERYTCIRFVPWNSTTKALYGLANDGRLLFTDHGGCSSHIGNNYEQFKTGQITECCHPSTCLHELGHALGLFHEHRHPDKGWIRRNWFAYKKQSMGAYHIFHEGEKNFRPFDISSPMHYTMAHAGSALTMLFPEIKRSMRFLHFFDLIADMYQCQERNCSSFSMECHNGGFVTLVKGKCACYCPHGLDPDTGCTTVRTKVPRRTFPGGSYAFPMPKGGCPPGHSFQTAVVTTTYNKVHGSDYSAGVMEDTLGSGGVLTSYLCTRNSPHDNAMRWPPGLYCLYRVGGSCPEDFQYTSITLETVPNGNSGNFSGMDLGENYIVQHFCCRGDGLYELPAELPNTQPYVLLSASGGCPLVDGMGRVPQKYELHDPSVSKLFSGQLWFQKFPPRIWRGFYGDTTFHFCYYYPLHDNPFPLPPCVDSQEDCPGLAHSGQCLTSSQVAADCPYSCNTCTGPTHGTGECVDIASDCQPHLCPTYSQAKRSDCSFTCRLCPEFCGDIIQLTRSNPVRVITSPNFPSSYSNNQDCFWQITGPPDTTLLLTFSAFDIEGSSSQCKDKLEINPAMIDHKGNFYCGAGLHTTFRSVRNEMELRLLTDYENPRTGFNATVRLALPEDHCFNQSQLGKDYRGDVSYTRDWKPCVPWNETKNCKHHTYAPYDMLDDLRSNHCRNPGNGMRPWCYTNSQCDRNYCDVCFLETTYDTHTDCASFKAAGKCSNTVEAREKCARTCEDDLPARTKPKVYTEVTCDPPSVPTDAAFGYNLKSVYSAGENVSFTCNDNVNISRLTTCMADGQWSPLGYVCGGCPDGWTFHDNSCFLGSNTPMTYDDAKAYCQSLQADVAEARTEEDMRFLIQLKDDGRRLWMGLRKDTTKKEKCFKWIDGTEPSWTRWDPGTDQNHECTWVGTTLDWHTVSCSAKLQFVCQRPARASSVCADLLSDCSSRVQDSPSLCQDEPDFAAFLCPRTCYGHTCQDPCASSPCQNGGKCYVRGGTFQCVCAKNYEGTRCENEITADCRDEKCECSIRLAIGHCARKDKMRHYILKYCPESCGMCDDGQATECSDKYSYCSQLSSQDCATNASHAFDCMKSCGLCVDGPTCVDQSDECGTWIDNGQCETNSTTRVLCPHGCNLCFNPFCYDTIPDCHWMADSYCQGKYHYYWMMDKCPYSCHHCSRRFQCYKQPCKNGGTCTEATRTAIGYTCDCSGTGYTGPTCEEVSCDPPSVPTDAASGYNLKSIYSAGENVSFTCNDNVNISRLTTCMADGQWSYLGYVCGGCPGDWTFHDNSCFLGSNTPMTYDDAKAYCQSLQADVAEARTEEDMRFLIQLKDEGQRLWMGLKKDTTNEEKCFKWNDGTEPSWTRWDPDTDRNHECTRIGTTLHWSTGNCSAEEQFVCQRPARASSVCADLLSDCSSRVQDSPSLCQDEPDFAAFLCLRTCYGHTCQDPCASSPCQNGGKCYVRGGTFQCVCARNYEGTRCENETVTANCTDEKCECSIRQAKGDCARTDKMRHYILGSCPRSCGMCEDGQATECSDKYSYCSQLSSQDCATNASHTFNCMKSCGLCVDGPTCVDQSDECGTWIDNGQCETNSTTRILCPHGCNLCFNPFCYDTFPECFWWGDHYCEGYYYHFMLGNCPYSCHHCSSRFQCYKQPCKNGGTCTEATGTADGYTCDCSGTGYTGPTCEVSCDPPSVPTDAASGYNLKSVYSVGENVSFTCNDNVNISRLTTCMADGQWSYLGYVCGGCPGGWASHDNSCFLGSNTPMTYDDAKAYCQSLQADVAEARTEEDMRFLIQLKGDGQRLWMGLKKDTTNKEKCFKWNDGTEPSWTRWDPDTDRNHECTRIGTTLHWSTGNCSAEEQFVCQRPARASSVCADLLSDCSSRVQDSPSLCQDEPDFAAFLCPRTCYGHTCQDPCASSPCQNGGKCYVRGGTFQCVCARNYEGTRCENETVTANCPDEKCECSIRQAKGDCARTDKMRHYILGSCPRSCGMCDDGQATECSDKYSYCSQLSSQDCATNASHTFNCMKSCGLCVDGPTCVDQSDECGTWIDNGQCETDSTTRVLCPHGCNLCFNPFCYDTFPECFWWGDHYCEGYYYHFMLGNCPYSCHHCSSRFQCYKQPCKNGGTCTEATGTADGYTCDCSGTGYTGPTCEEGGQ